MATLTDIFALIDSEHAPELCVDQFEIDSIERQFQCRLPDDLKAFYRRYSSVKLFPDEWGPTYRFIPVKDIRPTWIDILGINAEDPGPSNWLTFCDVLDGNYVAIDVISQDSKTNNIIDCFHETFAIPGGSTIVARSFTEFLDRAILGGGGVPYFVREGNESYGDAFTDCER